MLHLYGADEAIGALWRSLDIRCTVYIDDGIVGAESNQMAKLASDILTSDLDQAGLVLK